MCHQYTTTTSRGQNMLRRWVLLAGLLGIVFPGIAQQQGQVIPLVGCSITGTTPVNTMTSYTYSLTSGCAAPGAASWSTGCGTITSQNATSVTVLFNRSGISSCTITALNSSNATIASFNVTINQPPVLVGGTITNPTQTINYNTAPATINASGESGGYCPGTGYGYTWYYSTDSINFNAISGTNVANYQPGALTQTTWFKRLVTCGTQSQYTDNVAKVTVYSQIVPGTVTPATQTVNCGTNPSILSSTAATGGNGAYTYQWQSSPDGSFNPPGNVGSGGLTYQPTGLTTTTWFRILVTSNGATATSNAVVVNVNPQGTISPAAQTINFNTVPATLNAASLCGGNGSYQYQWDSCSSINGTYGHIGGATASTYTPPALISTLYYKLEITSGGTTYTTTAATVTVNPQVFPGTITPALVTIPSGSNPGTFTCTPATGGACNGNFKYQWQTSPDGKTWANTSAGDTTLSYNPGTLTTGKYFRMQVTCGTDVEYSNPSQVVIGAAPTNLNYIREKDFILPGITDTGTAGSMTGLPNVQQTTRYYDDLGRPVQTVVMQGSSSGSDLVNVRVYDPQGREAVKYLPYAAITSDGSYKSNAIGDQNIFNTSQFPGEQYYYGQTAFEPSPLNRVNNTYAPGSSWVGSQRGMGYNYWVNQAADSVQIWTVTNGALGIFGSYGVTGSYAAGDLLKNVTTDEQGHQVIIFIDKEGKTILKKVQLTATPDNGSGSGYTGWICTYYVYDILNNLRCVIQPATVAQLPAASWALSVTMLTEGCFRYEYDGKRRKIMDQTSGAAVVNMIYDGKDRLVMSQDGNQQAAKQYVYTQYDTLNRVIATGLLTDPANYSNPNYHRTQAAGSYSYPNLSSYTFVELTHTFYDDYSWLTSYGNPLPATRSTADDSYLQTASNTTYPYPQAATQSNATKGLVTGTRTNVLGTTNYLYTASYFDDHYRGIQTQNTNLTGGIDVLTTQYSFSGLPLQVIRHTNKSETNASGLLESNLYTYDSLNRMSSEVKKSVVYYSPGSFGSPAQLSPGNNTIVTNQYDALGHLVQKNLGTKPNAPAGTPLAKLTYGYTLRGWLRSINQAYVDAATNADQYFGEEIAYDKNASLGVFTPQYNGNITGVIWKGAGDGMVRKYDFNYDPVNRLTGAAFSQYVSGTGTGAIFDRSAGIDYTVTGLNYDGNGNIQSLTEKGWKLNSSPTIDSLAYQYQAGSNKLARVTNPYSDTTIRLGNFTDGTNTGDDYAYDVNGNLTLDNNKKISAIAYNYLNLPAVISMKGKGTITYTYDAAGSKLQKTVVDSTYATPKITTTLYLGPVTYQNDTLLFSQHEEGRMRILSISLPSGLIAYGYLDYYLKDHLGNVRTVLTEQTQTDTYPDASLEDATIATERLYYSNLDSGRVNKSTVPGYPNDTYTSPNNYIQQLSGASGGYKVGAGIVLKVMAGDSVNIRANSWYRQNGTSPGTPGSPLSSLILGLASGIVGTDPLHYPVNALRQAGVLDPGILSFLTDVSNDYSLHSGKPKGYLNFILFDEQFRAVYTNDGKNSGFQQVGADTTFTTHMVTGRVMTKSGWVYIYVSNETPNISVYFDNLQVTHMRGSILDESHYYPFGLSMAGISSQQAGNKPEQKYKFNKGSELQHKEFSDGTGLEWYATDHRMYDPQIGRWHVIEPKPTYQESPFVGMRNNPILYNDPLGDTIKVQGDIFANLMVAVAFSKIEKSPTAKSGINELINSKNSFSILLTDKKSYFEPDNVDKAYKNEKISTGEKGKDDPKIQGGSRGTIFWNPSQPEIEGENADYIPRPEIGLAHELLGHGIDANRGFMNDAEINSLSISEYQASHKENMIRSELGLPLRTYYSGTMFQNSETGKFQYLFDGIKLIRSGSFSTYYQNYDYSKENPPNNQ